MVPPDTVSTAVRRATLAALAAALACAGALGLPGPARASLPQESVSAYQAQLRAGHVQALVFHTKSHKLRVSLNGGRKLVVLYPAAQQQQLVRQAEAKGVTVKVVHKKGKGAHHKLRYVAGAIVVAVIVVVVAVLLVDRRRKRRADQGVPPPAVSAK
jgi:hypothetical protein